MLENMTQDKRLVLAERICDLFVEQEAKTEEAVAAIHLVMNLMNHSGLAIAKSQKDQQN